MGSVVNSNFPFQFTELLSMVKSHFPDLEIKVFQSLNCVLCNLPFARKSREDRSPRHLNCGLAMCDECFEKEKQLGEEERKHQCAVKDCFWNPCFAHFLIDVLSQEDSLTLSPSGDGYVLAKPFKVPKCIICHDEYSSQIEQKNSVTLVCNHIVCFGCYTRNQKPNDDISKENWPYKCFCPSCNKEILVTTGPRNRFQDFLDELPEMTRQMREIKGSRICDGCEEIGSMDKMYYCTDCTSKLCLVCAFDKHRSHETTRLLKREADEMVDVLQKDTSNLVKAYENSFLEMYKEITEDISLFGTKLALKEENDGKNVLKFEDFERELEEWTQLKTNFEAFSQELAPHLRHYGTKVKRLIETLEKGRRGGVYNKPGKNTALDVSTLIILKLLALFKALFIVLIVFIVFIISIIFIICF